MPVFGRLISWPPWRATITMMPRMPRYCCGMQRLRVLPPVPLLLLIVLLLLIQLRTVTRRTTPRGCSTKPISLRKARCPLRFDTRRIRSARDSRASNCTTRRKAVRNRVSACRSAGTGRHRPGNCTIRASMGTTGASFFLRPTSTCPSSWPPLARCPMAPVGRR